MRKSMLKRKHDIAHNFVYWNGSSCQVFFYRLFFKHAALAAHCEKQG